MTKCVGCDHRKKDHGDRGCRIRIKLDYLSPTYKEAAYKYDLIMAWCHCSQFMEREK